MRSYTEKTSSLVQLPSSPMTAQLENRCPGSIDLEMANKTKWSFQSPPEHAPATLRASSALLASSIAASTVEVASFEELDF